MDNPETQAAQVALNDQVNASIPVKKNKKPPIHCLVYGDAGSKKSTFAATFPKPMLVFCFDPFGKDMPYLRKGVPGEVVDQGAYKARNVYDKGPKNLSSPIIKIEYFHDEDATHPQAYRAFMQRMAHATDLGDYKTLVFDSVTFMNLAKFYDAKYRQNPTAKDPRQWYMAAKESLEEMLMIRVAGLYQNIVVVAHINEDKDESNGRLVYNPAVPGKLSKGLPAGYSEFYRAFVDTDDEGANTFLLQTEKDSRFNAASQLPAPNPCEPKYSALWMNWKE